MLLVIASCGPEKGNNLSEYAGDWVLEIQDSVQVAYLGEIGLLNQDLTLDRKIAVPFPFESRDMQGSFPNMDVYREELYIHYPGRDGISFYGEHYFRDIPLLEKFPWPQVMHSHS